MKHGKLILAFNLVLLVVFMLKAYQDYSDIDELKNLSALSESSALAHLTKSFRQTYQNVIVTNKIQINERTINLLPVKTIGEVSQRFSEYVDSEVIVRTVSDRPRNPVNQSNPEETKIIQFFRDNPNEKSVLRLSENGGYIYAEPLYIKKFCLKCHGKKESAPKLIQELYDDAYDYKLGDIRGLLSISYFKNDFITRLDKLFVKNLIAIVILFASLFIGIILLIRTVDKKDAEHLEYMTEQNEKLRTLSITDNLTGLKTREYYSEIISSEMMRAKRESKGLVFLMLDLDNFKAYNDTYGHHLGDVVLQKVSAVFQERFHRGSDFAFRFGGEEFVMLYSCDDESTAINHAEAVRRCIYELNIEHSGNTPFGRVTISGGIEIYNPSVEDIDETTLYKRADVALYRAKEEGRNQIYIPGR